MPAERFDIIFHGEFLDGQDPEVVRSQVGRLLNASASQIEQLFSGRAIVLKKSVDSEIAGRFRLAFRKAGALVEIRTSVLPTPSAVMMARLLTPSEWELAPPNSGSLEDYAIRPPATLRPPPDIDWLTLATPGVQLDRSPAPDPIVIDTKNLDVIQGQTWSLEDCKPQIRPILLPNIQNLNLSAPGTTLDETKPPVPVQINTSAIKVVEDKNWNLKDCQPPPPPEPVIDLSGFDLDW